MRNIICVILLVTWRMYTGITFHLFLISKGVENCSFKHTGNMKLNTYNPFNSKCISFIENKIVKLDQKKFKSCYMMVQIL